MATVGPLTPEQLVWKARIAEAVERQKQWKRVERISLAVAVGFSFLFVVMLCRLAARAIICARVGC